MSDDYARRLSRFIVWGEALYGTTCGQHLVVSSDSRWAGDENGDENDAVPESLASYSVIARYGH